MVAACVRGLMFPMRWAVATLPRKSLVRSACVPVLKAVSHRPELMASLSEVRPLDRRDISFEPTTSWVLEDVYWFGVQGYEGVLADIWGDLCSRSTSVLEIGGNVGFYSVLGGKTARGSYTVVEPHPHIAEVLRSNLRRNAISRVEVVEGAAIAEPKARTVCLNIPNEGRSAPTGAFLDANVELAGRSATRQIEVKGFPITQLLEGRDLVKIDAEGIEHALLRAAMPTLVNNRPTIVVEVLPESTTLAQVLSELAITARYEINVVPSYGSNDVIPVSAAEFTAAVPAHHNSKDVMLTPRR
jgi:FkbM family methyltransferase